jgi:hypothetical protein
MPPKRFCVARPAQDSVPIMLFADPLWRLLLTIGATAKMQLFQPQMIAA